MKPREPRYKVLVRARMKAGAAWHDTCILNISSRGMLMQAGVPPVRGSYLEIRRGAVLVMAQVMWTRSHRFGVKSQDLLSIASITGEASPSETCAEPAKAERRQVARPCLPAHERSRLQGRTMEYGFAAALAVSGAIFAAGEVYSLLATPAVAITAALSGE